MGDEERSPRGSRWDHRRFCTPQIRAVEQRQDTEIAYSEAPRYLATVVASLAASSLQEEERQPDRHKKQPISPSGPEVHVI